ncbi:hypothetical protein GCM10027600_32360 [Nocardioides ginsengisegetis]
MNVRARLPTAAGLLLISSWTAGCDPDEQGEASCSLSASIAFESREYIAVGSLPGLKRTEIHAGKRLGTAEAATCPGQAVQEVHVFKVVGVPVAQAVFAKPEFGLMERWNQDGAIK